MKKVKYISARKGQTIIVMGVVLLHIVLAFLVYFLLFGTNIINFEKIAVFLCSGNLLKKYVWKFLLGGFLVFMGCGAVRLVVVGPPAGYKPNSSTESGGAYIYGIGYRNWTR